MMKTLILKTAGGEDSLIRWASRLAAALTFQTRRQHLLKILQLSHQHPRIRPEPAGPPPSPKPSQCPVETFTRCIFTRLCHSFLSRPSFDPNIFRFHVLYFVLHPVFKDLDSNILRGRVSVGLLRRRAAKTSSCNSSTDAKVL